MHHFNIYTCKSTLIWNRMCKYFNYLLYNEVVDITEERKHSYTTILQHYTT